MTGRTNVALIAGVGDGLGGALARRFARGGYQTVLTDNALKSDWVHPNAKGYARIAASLAELLKRAKAI